MARKNILSGLLDPNRPAPPSGTETPAPAPETKSASGSRGLGALGAVTRSIDALAAKAEAARQLEAQLTSGAVIIDLDPSQIERSFVNDRLGEDEQAFQELVQAIRERGQDSPILVRPHPNKAGIYQIAFGHRRARAAQELGIPVRAVVKPLSDVEHVIAQGQENSARADLSFIERAMFAARLEDLGFGRDVMMTALGLDKTTLSKMLSVSNRIPGDILNRISDARMVGRDRWHEMATLFDGPETAERARHYVGGRLFGKITDAETRFQTLLRFLKTPEDRTDTATAPGAERSEWAGGGGAVKATISKGGRSFTIALKSAKAAAFGAYLASRLDGLYEAFEKETQKRNGD
jgi:ParB family chromosome partitioning protein